MTNNNTIYQYKFFKKKKKINQKRISQNLLKSYFLHYHQKRRRSHFPYARVVTLKLFLLCLIKIYYRVFSNKERILKEYNH